MDVSQSNLNNKINRIHERALRLVYQNNLSFSELLDLDNFVTVHQKNSQVLVTEIYKVKNGIASEILKGNYGLQSVRYLSPKIWEFLPNNIKYSNSLSKLKKLIKSWKPEACPCRLRKTYIAQVRFI